LFCSIRCVFCCLKNNAITLSFFLSEVFAAREKNGIYIPRDRYLQEEAEKKVFCFSIELTIQDVFRGKRTTDIILFSFPQAMTEKIEKLELDMDTKEKVHFPLFS
jgi:hypothetical protein